MAIFEVRSTLTPRSLMNKTKQDLVSMLWRQINELEQVDAAVARHPRAWKLMQKGKPFIVIAHDEPYFAQVYATIRQHETDAGRWSADDEVAYQKAIAEPDARQFNLPYEG